MYDALAAPAGAGLPLVDPFPTPDASPSSPVRGTTGGSTRRRGSPTLAVVVALLVALPTGFFLIGPLPAGSNGPAGASPTSVAASAVADAVASLAQGLGPASRAPVTCQNLVTQASCSADAPSTLAPGLPASTPTPGTGWANLTNLTAATPSCRSSLGLTYDAAGGYVLLFDGLAGCGSQGAVHDDTWMFTGGVWTNLTANLSQMPSPRSQFQLTYDPADRYVVLFGGASASDGAILGDTWVWTGGNWTQLSPTTSPSARFQYSETWDGADGVVLLYGGAPSAGAWSYDNDTWTFVRGNWTLVNTTSSPGERRAAGLAYDAAAGYVVLFGGVTPTAMALSDTWTYVGGTWTNLGLNASSSPSARWDPEMSYDPSLGAVVLFGGCTSLGCYSDSNETWVFAGGAWANLSAALPIAPPGRGSAEMTYDARDEYLVFFAGASASGRLDDTWAYTGGNYSGTGGGSGGGSNNSSAGPGFGYGGRGAAVTPASTGWTNLTPGLGVIPLCLSSMGLTYDAAGGYVLLFDGLAGCGSQGAVHDDTWMFTGGVWTNLTANLSQMPSPRSQFQLTYDPVDRYVVLFGGASASDGAILGDTWVFSGGNWTQLSPTTSPSARFQYSETWDGADGVVLLYGGAPSAGASSYDNDTWTFVRGNWTLVNTTSSPGERRAAGLAYDAAAGYVVLFGGVTPTATALSDTWTYVGGTWTNLGLNASSSPSARWDPGMTWLPAMDAILLFGGCTSLGCYSMDADSWAWSGGAWYNLTPALNVSPSARGSAEMAYDAAAGYAIFVGGAQNGGRLNDTWVFTNDTLPTNTSGTTGGSGGGNGSGNGSKSGRISGGTTGNGSGNTSGDPPGTGSGTPPTSGAPLTSGPQPGSVYGRLPNWPWAGGRLGFLLGLTVGLALALSLAYVGWGRRRRPPGAAR